MAKDTRLDSKELYRKAALAMRADPKATFDNLTRQLGSSTQDVVDMLRSSSMHVTGLSDDVNGWPVNVLDDLSQMLTSLLRRDIEHFIGIALRHKSAWRTDGALIALSDLAGAATRNKTCAPTAGFYGHPDAYYEKSISNAYTEVFANLTALAGNRLPGWWSIIKHLSPTLATEYERTIKATAV